MRQLPVLSETADMLEYLITTGNEGEMPENKMTVIGDLDRRICDALTEQGITSARYTDTGKAAYAINDRIENIDLRNLNILSGVTFI